MTLRDLTDRIFIIAHREDTSRLERLLTEVGFSVEVWRRTYTEEEENYALQARCLLSHCDVWRKIARGGEPALVLEADFVPVETFPVLPSPFDPRETSKAMAWLYAGGPVVYEIDGCGRAIGHSSTTVALAMTSAAAADLVSFGEAELRASGGGYTPWDTYLSHQVRGRMGVVTYVPFRQYGEHGGRANAEHVQRGLRGWHQADRLYGRLAFPPDYAEGSRVRYRLTRLRANLRGLLRLATWRYFEFPAFKTSRQKAALLGYAMRRWLW